MSILRHLNGKFARSFATTSIDAERPYALLVELWANNLASMAVASKFCNTASATANAYIGRRLARHYKRAIRDGCSNSCC